MTAYLIEVRAISSQYDTQARRLAQDITHLPARQLPSLAAISASTDPLTLHTAHLYHLSGAIAPQDIQQLIQQLLVDPVVQEARIVPEAESVGEAHTVDVFFHPGVTDTLAESVLAGAEMLGISGLAEVETGQRYLLDRRLSEHEARVIAEALLYNPVIQQYSLSAAGTRLSSSAAPQHLENVAGDTPDRASTKQEIVLLCNLADAQLLDLSKQGMLALNLEEMRAIQHYYRELGREPTQVELETLAQTWSEHCSHKTFKAEIRYRELDSAGNVVEQETIPGLLKSYIMRATREVKRPWVVSAFSDNAGIIRYTETQDIAFKVETHNHPSAVEPFGGANTGVGGVIRDVLGVSAWPIACTDILCFGPLDTPGESLPAGVLSPRRIAGGVINGVRDYGNKMGIPTVNGAVLYHPGYIYNPLVFCGCLGILPHGSHPQQVEAGDLIVVLGGRTGRDGIHGATFSSGEMSSEIHAQAGSAVQIGAPITEKKVADVVVQARDRHLYSAITDCGAGGFSSAVGEMGAETGAAVELSAAPLKYQGLAPWEIWLSEAQERMVLAVPPRCLDELLEICAIEEVEVSVIGTFTGDGRLKVRYKDQVVADMDMAFLHDGRPGRSLEAVWQSPAHRDVLDRTRSNQEAVHNGKSEKDAWASTLLALLGHPTIASKEAVVRRYDHEVQGATMLKPLVGRAGNGPGDATVLQPILDEPTRAGIVLSNGVNPLYGTVDPYAMAANAIDEALRNLTAVGGDIERAAILDNFCWGNPTDPAQLGALVRATKGCYDAATGFGVPFISGKDSLNNEYRAGEQRLPVIATLLISAVGVIDDAEQTIDMSLKAPGNLLYLIGRTYNELAGSYFAELQEAESFTRHFPDTSVPQVNVPMARATMKALGEAIRKGFVQTCHDLSEGGLALGAAEMALASLLGATLDVGSVLYDKDSEAGGARGEPGTASRDDYVRNAILLFSESASRFLVEVTQQQREAFESYMRSQNVNDMALVGRVTDTERLIVRSGEQTLLDMPVHQLQEAWKGEQA